MVDHQKKAETICNINELFQLNKTLEGKINQLEGKENQVLREEGFFQFENLYMEYLVLEEQKLEKQKREMMKKIMEKTQGGKKELKILEEVKTKESLFKKVKRVLGKNKK